MVEDIIHVTILFIQSFLIRIFYLCDFFLVLQQHSFNVQLKPIILAFEVVDLIFQSFLLFTVSFLE